MIHILSYRQFHTYFLFIHIIKEGSKLYNKVMIYEYNCLRNCRQSFLKLFSVSILQMLCGKSNIADCKISRNLKKLA